MTTHELKIWPQYFKAVVSKKKRFEYRKNDRDFQVGDMLILKEYYPKKDTYSGKEIKVIVTYILPIKYTDNVIMSIDPIRRIYGG